MDEHGNMWASTGYIRGKPRPGASASLAAVPFPKPGTTVDHEYLVIKPPRQFSGTLAADLRRPPRKVVLKRADGRLAAATAEELRAYFHVPAHPNVALPTQVVEHKCFAFFATEFRPEGSLVTWMQAREADGVRPWALLAKDAAQVSNPMDTGQFSPLWSPKTILHSSYKAPKGKAKVYTMARAMRRGTLYTGGRLVASPPTSPSGPTSGSFSLSPVRRRRRGRRPPAQSTPTSALTSSPPPSPARSVSGVRVGLASPAHSVAASVGASPSGFRRGPTWDYVDPWADDSDDDIDVDPEELAVRVRLALHTARGLHHIHSQGDPSGRQRGLMHLDLHPGNILVDKALRPKKQHPRSRKVQRAFFHARVTDFSATLPDRTVLRTVSRLNGSPVLVNVKQQGRATVEAAAFDPRSGTSTRTTLSAPDPYADVTMTRALRELTLLRDVQSAEASSELEAEAEGGREDGGGGGGGDPPASSTVTWGPNSVDTFHPTRPVSPTRYDAGPVSTWGFVGASVALTEEPATVPSDDTLEALFGGTYAQLDTLEHTLLSSVSGPQGFAGYRAPEQRRFGSGALTPKTDVFSFGLVLAFLVSGQPRRVVRREVKNGLKLTYEPLATYMRHAFPRAVLRSNVTAVQLAQLCRHCTDPNPASRPAAGDCAMLLESILARLTDEVDQPADDPDPLAGDPTLAWLNEAKYHAYGRSHWADAAACLRRIIPDPDSPPPDDRDWTDVWRFAVVVKRRTHSAGHHKGTFPVLATAARTRGVPGHLSLGVYPLHEAVRTGDLGEVRSVLAATEGLTLFDAMQREVRKWWVRDEAFARVLHDLLPACGTQDVTSLLLEEKDTDGETALRVACKRGTAAVSALPVARYLIAAGADPNAHNEWFEETVLHLAAAGGDVTMVDHLLLHGFDPDVPDRIGATPLHKAASAGHIKVCRALLGWGASVQPADRDHRSPLHLAVGQGHLKVVKLLVAWGATVVAPAPVQVGPRLNRKDIELPVDTALRNGPAPLARYLDTVTQKQTVCNRPGCGVRARTRKLRTLSACSLCLTTWYCSPACEETDVPRHTGRGKSASCKPVHHRWPQRGVQTPWGVAVLRSMTQRQVAGDAAAGVDGQDLEERKVDGGGVGGDMTVAHLVCHNGPNGQPTHLYVNPFKLDVFLGLEVEVPVHYELPVYEPPPPPKKQRVLAKVLGRMGDAISKKLGQLTSGLSRLRRRMVTSPNRAENGAEQNRLQAAALSLRGVLRKLGSASAVAAARHVPEPAGGGYWYGPPGEMVVRVEDPLPAAPPATPSRGRKMWASLRGLGRSNSPSTPVGHHTPEPAGGGYWYAPPGEMVVRVEDPLPDPPAPSRGRKLWTSMTDRVRKSSASPMARLKDTWKQLRSTKMNPSSILAAFRTRSKRGDDGAAEATVAVPTALYFSEDSSGGVLTHAPELATRGYWYAPEGEMVVREEDPLPKRARPAGSLPMNLLTRSKPGFTKSMLRVRTAASRMLQLNNRKQALAARLTEARTKASSKLRAMAKSVKAFRDKRRAEVLGTTPGYWYCPDEEEVEVELDPPTSMLGGFARRFKARRKQGAAGGGGGGGASSRAAKVKARLQHALNAARQRSRSPMKRAQASFAGLLARVRKPKQEEVAVEEEEEEGQSEEGAAEEDWEDEEDSKREVEISEDEGTEVEEEGVEETKTEAREGQVVEVAGDAGEAAAERSSDADTADPRPHTPASTPGATSTTEPQPDGGDAVEPPPSTASACADSAAAAQTPDDVAVNAGDDNASHNSISDGDDDDDSLAQSRQRKARGRTKSRRGRKPKRK